MKKLIFLLLMLPLLLTGQNISLELFADGFSAPLDLVHAGDDRLFVVEKSGKIKILNADGSVNPEPFIDLDPIVNSGANERGLLGLAFHPNYNENGYFYVNYTANSGGATVISRFSVTDDPNIGDPSSESLVITISQPYNNHNGGGVKFGPDGYLYIGTGDGGAGGDPDDYGQNGMSLLGKMLRLDIDGGEPYVIPNDNPFIGVDDIRDEIWATGLRNPWRYSFDTETGDLWIGDVGQNKFEEIDFQSASSTGGENYGWRCYEGNATFNTSNCNLENDFIFPVFEYANDEFVDGCSVTGGLVYRGVNHKGIYGDYICVDFCSGQFWATTQQACGTFTTREIYRGNFQDYSAFGEDINKEMYVVALSSGEIHRIVSDCKMSVDISTNNVGCGGEEGGEVVIDATSPSGTVSVEWSDGSTEINRENLPAGTYELLISDGVCEISRCIELKEEVLDVTCDIQLMDIFMCPGDMLEMLQFNLQDILSECQVMDDIISVNIFEQGGLLGQYFESEEIILPVSDSTNYSFQLVTNSCESELIELITISFYDTDSTTIGFTDGLLVAEEVANATLYIWYLDGEEFAQTTANTLEITEGGNYSVVVQNEECHGPFSPELFVNLVGTVDYTNILNRSIFPNPFLDQINIQLKLEDKESVYYSVLDLTGRTLNSGYLESRDLKFVINSSNWESGIYLLQMESKSFYFTEKLLKF